MQRLLSAAATTSSRAAGGSPSSEHGGAGIEQALARALAPGAQDPIAEIALASAVSVGGTLSI